MYDRFLYINIFNDTASEKETNFYAPQKTYM